MKLGRDMEAQPCGCEFVVTDGRCRPARLEPRLPGLVFDPGAKGGEQTGPSPVDRGRPGTKRHVVVERGGLPLAAVLSAANVHDSRMLEIAIDAVPSIAGPRGRPRFRPKKLHADKGYDYTRCRAALRARGIIARTARRGQDSSQHLGRPRWVVERTPAWLNRFRRLRVRYERRADIHQASLSLGCALICHNHLQRFC